MTLVEKRVDLLERASTILPASPQHERRPDAQISSWAAQHARTDLDLDAELEKAGLEALDFAPDLPEDFAHRQDKIGEGLG